MPSIPRETREFVLFELGVKYLFKVNSSTLKISFVKVYWSNNIFSFSIDKNKLYLYNVIVMFLFIRKMTLKKKNLHIRSFICDLQLLFFIWKLRANIIFLLLVSVNIIAGKLLQNLSDTTVKHIFFHFFQEFDILLVRYNFFKLLWNRADRWILESISNLSAGCSLSSIKLAQNEISFFFSTLFYEFSVIF